MTVKRPSTIFNIRVRIDTNIYLGTVLKLPDNETERSTSHGFPANSLLSKYLIGIVKLQNYTLSRSSWALDGMFYNIKLLNSGSSYDTLLRAIQLSIDNYNPDVIRLISAVPFLEFL